MDSRYDTYCAVDPLFYDSPAAPTAAEPEYGRELSLPDGWRREHFADWVGCTPPDEDLPFQGWKVHVSACLDNAADVLVTVWDYCVGRNLSFKFVRGARMLLIRNGKYASRDSSGKFVTIYPHDEAELELVCKELDELLAGWPGPYILSDLRYGEGPVYVRYGGFTGRYCQLPDGRTVPAIARPDGTLVPDQRGPVFQVPEWLELPAFLTPCLEARSATTMDGLPYRVDAVMHFSNGGGIYEARDTRTGERVVLKEGRRYAGLDSAGRDAVTRVRHESTILRELSGLDCVPAVRDTFTIGDHEFLVLEHIDGHGLNKELVARFPLIDPDTAPETIAGYVDWVVEVHGQVERAVRDIHERGVVYGDLHLFNVLVQPDGRIRLIDFEVAARAGAGAVPALRNQGFAAPRDRTGFAVDEYALACLRLALFLPLTQMLRLAPEKTAHLADVVRAHFPVPAGFLDEAVTVITGRSAAASLTAGAMPDVTAELTPDRWRTLSRGIAAGIAASASPDRTDRLFPGDIEQFHRGGIGLAHGAAGVLWALSVAGLDRDPRHDDWLIGRALAPPSGTSLGLWDGLHGVAWALQATGHEDVALALVNRCLREPWPQLGPDLMSGLAGIGLSFAYFGAVTGEGALWDAAWRSCELVAERLDQLGSDQRVSGGRHPHAGLIRGGAGAALLFLRLHELSGDAVLLDIAARALRLDLRRCVVRASGAMEVDEGWRTMPYLAHGSVGIGMVLDQYLAHRPDEEFAAAAAAIRRAARAPFYAQSGLFAGRAGIITYLAGRRAWCPDEAAADTRELETQTRRLPWHALPFRNGIAFPGEQLLRLSMDLATGGAGVILALAAAEQASAGTDAVCLPFMRPLPGAQRAPRAGNHDDPDNRREV